MRANHVSRIRLQNDRARTSSGINVVRLIVKLYDYSREAIAVGLPDGPLRGVPYLMKDLTSAVDSVNIYARFDIRRRHAALAHCPILRVRARPHHAKLGGFFDRRVDRINKQK